MHRAWWLTSFLSVAACISYPDLRTVEEDRAASVSPDGPNDRAERIALVEDLGIDDDAGTHPDRDASAGGGGSARPHDAGAPPPPPPPQETGGEPEDEEDAAHTIGKGKGKKKPKKD